MGVNENLSFGSFYVKGFGYLKKAFGGETYKESFERVKSKLEENTYP